MRSRIIDGERWIAERLKFLRARLTQELSDDERQAVEHEIEVLSREPGITIGGNRFPRLFLRRRWKRGREK